MSNRPSWTLSEAAERTGASRSTIRRYRETGKFPNAYKGTDKQWRVPLEDILASGLTLSGQAQVEQVTTLSEQPIEHALEPLSERVRELEALLAVERARAAGLERVAAAAEANAADLRMALRMIEAVRPERAGRAHPEHVNTPTGQPLIPPAKQGEQPEQAHPEATPGSVVLRGGWRRLLWGRN